MKKLIILEISENSYQTKITNSLTLLINEEN